jgi:plasmid stability protein
MKVQLATRLDTGLRQRLRIYAAVSGRTVEDVVGAALDGYLPPTADMVGHAVSGHREGALLTEHPEVA